MFAAIGAALLLFAPSANATTYTFTGQCSDCDGTGIGTLVLSGYTEGQALQISNFVSFNYESNLTSLSVNSDTLSDISGILGPGLPGSYLVEIFTIDNKAFQSAADGAWVVGALVAHSDFGRASHWDNTTAVATPVPGALPLFATGLAGLGWFAHRRRKRAA
ncbi:MAG TPA: PEP-CTERM sorting domain-containing protein [Xanthobacteraceae bacterium]|nr:PEP-CTERM sorting domain-containing protein [Xanthobacteraceae bacterium]